MKGKPRDGYKLVPELAEVRFRYLGGPLNDRRVAYNRLCIPEDLIRIVVQGKHEVACYNLCRIFLMDDANYPCWIVLVPQINDVKVRPSHHYCSYRMYMDMVCCSGV